MLKILEISAILIGLTTCAYGAIPAENPYGNLKFYYGDNHFHSGLSGDNNKDSHPLIAFINATTRAKELGTNAAAGGDGYDDGYEDAMDDCPCPPRLTYSGFYLGGGVGYEGYQVQRQPWIDNDYIGKLNTHANGWNGRLFGGYGRTFYSNYYLGGELFLGTSGANGKDTINSLSYNGKFSAGTSYGVSIIPGYKLNSGSLLYGRVGYINTDLKVQESTNTTSSSMTQWTSGFNLGLGVEMPIYNKFSARLEYDYIDYSSFNQKQGALVGSDNSPTDNRGSLDILFRF